MQGLWNMLVMVQDMCSPWWGMITTINSVYSSLGREDGGGSSVHGSELIPFWFPWPPAAAAFFEWTLLCPSAKSGWEWTAEASSTEGHLSLQTPANTGVSSSSLQGCQFGWWAPTQEAEMFIWFLAHSQIPQGLTFIMEEVKQRHNTFTVIPKSCLGVKNSWFWQGQEDFWVCCCWFRGSVFLISVFFPISFSNPDKMNQDPWSFPPLSGTRLSQRHHNSQVESSGLSFPLLLLQNCSHLEAEPLSAVSELSQRSTTTFCCLHHTGKINKSNFTLTSALERKAI